MRYAEAVEAVRNSQAALEDSLARLTEGQARAAAIEEGADRPAGLLIADAEFSGRRVVAALGAVPGELLDTPVAWRRPVEARFLPQLRWRELEIHHVDLGLGYTAADWPAGFVEMTLAVELPALAALEPEVAVPDGLARHELLAWLIGRPTKAGLPDLPGWPV